MVTALYWEDKDKINSDNVVGTYDTIVDKCKHIYTYMYVSCAHIFIYVLVYLYCKKYIYMHVTCIYVSITHTRTHRHTLLFSIKKIKQFYPWLSDLWNFQNFSKRKNPNL